MKLQNKGRWILAIVIVAVATVAVLGAIMQIRIYSDLRAFVGRGEVQALTDKPG